jgi:hypothetical protein
VVGGAAGLLLAITLGAAWGLDIGLWLGIPSVLLVGSPWLSATIVTFTGRAALRPHEIVVYRTGYRVAGPVESWQPWNAFVKARENKDGLVLHVNRSKRHIHVWTSRLGDTDMATLRSILVDAGLGPKGKAAA